MGHRMLLAGQQLTMIASDLESHGSQRVFVEDGEAFACGLEAVAGRGASFNFEQLAHLSWRD